MDRPESSLSKAIRTSAAIVGIVIGVITLIANPYHLPQWGVLATAVFIIVFCVAFLVSEYKPWKWSVSRRKQYSSFLWATDKTYELLSFLPSSEQAPRNKSAVPKQLLGEFACRLNYPRKACEATFASQGPSLTSGIRKKEETCVGLCHATLRSWHWGRHSRQRPHGGYWGWSQASSRLRRFFRTLHEHGQRDDRPQRRETGNK
jgi:hypothetical protein